jgi:membrane-associated protease RseP (regulator of RpoE activity)
VLAGLVLVVVATALHVAGLVAGRWAAGHPFGSRSLHDARHPSTDKTLGLALARAGGGVVGWYLVAAFLVTLSALVVGETRLDDTSMRVHVSPAGPAARGGMKEWDRIVSVEGRAVADWPALRAAIAKHPEEPVRIVVERGGEEHVLQVVPTPTPARIMVSPPALQEPTTFGRAIAKGLGAPFQIIALWARSVARAFSGSDQPPAELSGPVGIVRETAESNRGGMGHAIGFLGLVGAYFLPIMAIASVAVALGSRRKSKALPTAGKSS